LLIEVSQICFACVLIGLDWLGTTGLSIVVRRSLLEEARKRSFLQLTLVLNVQARPIDAVALAVNLLKLQEVYS